MPDDLGESRVVLDSSYPSTPPVTFDTWCPGCPPKKKLDKHAELKYCSSHFPSEHGESDRLASESQWFPHTVQDGSERRFCNFIHRGHLDPHE